MVTKKPDSPRRNPRKTKEDLVSSYTSAVQAREQEPDVNLDPATVAEEKSDRAAVQLAEQMTAATVSSQIHQLKSEIVRLLADLEQKLERQVAQFVDLTRAIHAKESDLKEVYEIERNASSLAALIDAQTHKREEFDAQLAAESATLGKEIQAKREQWDREKKEIETTIKEAEKAETQRRERLKTEFDYDFKREQQLARDKFKDESAKLDKELQAKKEAAEKQLSEREKAVKNAETELAELRARTQKFQSELDGAVKKAVADATERLTATSNAHIALLKAEFEGEKNVLLSKLESVQATVQRQAEQIGKLTQQHEMAYEKVQNIAVRAIEGSAGLKSIANLQDAISDQLKKQSREDKPVRQ